MQMCLFLYLLWPNVCWPATHADMLCRIVPGPERIFSAAGRMHDDLKKSVKEGKLEMEVKLHHNL